MNIDLLYIIPLYFNNDTIPSFIHMGFGLGTAWLIYHYLSNKLGCLAGLLGVFVFLSTPIVVRMSTVAYVDLGLFFLQQPAFSRMSAGVTASTKHINGFFFPQLPWVWLWEQNTMLWLRGFFYR